MTEEERSQLRLALSIFSGRTEPYSLHESDFSLLGYDIYKLREYGDPSADAIRGQCEDIVFGLIVKALE